MCRDECARDRSFALVSFSSAPTRTHTLAYSQPRMKVSDDHDKVSIPGEKEAYRLFNSRLEPVLDLLLQVGTAPPQANKRILCRHPFDASKRVYVTPFVVQPLHRLYWDGPAVGRATLARGGAIAHADVLASYPSLTEVKAHVTAQLSSFRDDHLRRLNPTPYKTSISSDLFLYMQDLWSRETPIPEIS
jgi:nicotinate phosphoribosyltransferase